MKVKSIIFNDVISPMEDGIEPTMVLLPMIKLVILPKYPISVGRDPVILYPLRSTCNTLAKSTEPDTLPHVTPLNEQQLGCVTKSLRCAGEESYNLLVCDQAAGEVLQTVLPDGSSDVH